MGANTSIQWTDATWNCLRGCSRVSEGCRNCYAERQAARFSGKGEPYEGLAQIVRHNHRGDLPTSGYGGRPSWTGEVRFIEEHLTDPLHWRKPRRIFVNSMSDLFHEKVMDNWIDQIFAVMFKAKQHTFQILTKRPERMRDFLSDRPYWTCRHDLHWPNVWLGVSVEDQKTANERIPLLLQTPADVRWVSYEPALVPVDFSRWLCRMVVKPNDELTDRMVEEGWSHPGGEGDHQPVNWLVIGGESGPGVRPFSIQWARDVIAQCKTAGVPCFVKQLGAYVISRNDTGFEGDTRRSWPMDTRTEEETSEVYQGAPVRVRLKDRKGGNVEEWPEDLRVREFPR